jgi:hypothetical protein
MLPTSDAPHRLPTITARSALRVLAAIVAFAAVTHPSTANAIEVSDRGFRVRFDPPRGATCVVLPESATTPDDCDGIDTAKVRAAVRSDDVTTLGVAIVNEDEWTYLFQIARMQISRTWEFDSNGAAEFVRGVRTGIRNKMGPAADATDVAPKESRIHGVQVLSLEVTPTLPPDSPLRSVAGFYLTYAVMTADGLYSMTFTSSPEHASEVRAIAEDTLKSLVGKPAKSVDEHRSEIVGRLLPFAVGIVVALILGVRAIVTRRRPNAVAAPPSAFPGHGPPHGTNDGPGDAIGKR